MIDKDLFFAENQRPAIAPGPAFQAALFPQTLTPNYWDLRAVVDLARAMPLYANFRVASAFNNQAGNLLRFMICCDNDPSFINVLVDPSLILARSHDFTSVGLGTIGVTCQVVIPPLSDLAKVGGDGRRYFALGVEALVPAADWVAGGVDAFLTQHALPPRPQSFPAGY